MCQQPLFCFVFIILISLHLVSFVQSLAVVVSPNVNAKRDYTQAKVDYRERLADVESQYIVR